jgi:peptidoglycan DL-endopeptidase CwlO
MADRPSGRRKRAWPLVAVLIAMLAAPGAGAPAFADPDGEGGTPTLREKLEQAATAYYDAKGKLTSSQKRQAEITKKLREAEIALVRLNTQISTIAAARYKGGQLGILNSLLLDRQAPGAMLQGAAVAQYLVWRDDDQLRRYRVARDESQRQKELLNAEIALQKSQFTQMDKAKRAAEKALAAVGGMVTSGYTGPVPEAQPAPRTASGGWPRESCSINDPTTSGCITPRMFHTLNEARLAGFRHYVSCYRSGGSGEHPKGRACDFAAAANGFGGTATGSARTYGNRLAAWAKANAEALGVLYVIWFRQIWMPGIGWRSYSGWGDPSSEHTNHVHISML